MTLDPTSVDLQRLSESLRNLVGSEVVPGSELEGKTVLRDGTRSLLHCSDLEAENVVDTLVARGFVRFREHRDVPHGAAWFLLVPL